VEKQHLDRILKIRLPITIGVILISVALTFLISKSERDGVGYQPEQPIKYSHQLHAGQLKIDCKYCHTGVEKSRHAGVPSASICMNCHSVARRDRPEIIKLIKYYTDGTPIPWKRVYKLGDFAYFNHSAHVIKGINCAHCHGDVANAEVISQKVSFRMSQCLSCHRDAHNRLPELGDKIKNGPVNCSNCHR
jgi:hypothetical protein